MLGSISAMAQMQHQETLHVVSHIRSQIKMLFENPGILISVHYRNMTDVNTLWQRSIRAARKIPTLSS